MPGTQYKPILAPKSTRLRHRLETHAAAVEVCKRLADMRLTLASLPSLDRFAQLQLDAVRVVEMSQYDAAQCQLAKDSEG